MLNYKDAIYISKKEEYDNYLSFLSSFIKKNLILFLSIVIILSTLFFSSTSMPKGDFLITFNKYHNSFLDFFFKYITYLGDALLYLPLAILCFFIKKKNIKYLIYLLLIQTGFSWFLKKLIFKGAPRPKAYFSNDLFSSLHKVPEVTIHSYNSFPSGHTLTVFSLFFFTLFFFKINKNWQFTLLLLTCLAGLSRVYLLQHFLIDVAFGAFLGFISTFIVLVIKKT
ncbi:phosphatase PAP2 family protein [Tenacibaculum piscium]|uniref:phosphatase PAP2 family protein n=1 Tax=Tenacibaculum piscium TaxID=1458515 RepID=UPI001F490FE0|nr:phosphatase PAP2 family protein [Tenacibaculum piscium]